MKSAWIQAHRDSYPVAVLCRALQVSTSKAQPGLRAQRSERIGQAVAAVYQGSNQVYGSHKIARTLQVDADPDQVNFCITATEAASTPVRIIRRPLALWGSAVR